MSSTERYKRTIKYMDVYQYLERENVLTYTDGISKQVQSALVEILFLREQTPSLSAVCKRLNVTQLTVQGLLRSERNSYINILMELLPYFEHYRETAFIHKSQSAVLGNTQRG